MRRAVKTFVEEAADQIEQKKKKKIEPKAMPKPDPPDLPFFPALPSEHEAWSVNFRKLFRVEQDNFCPEGKNLLTNVTNRAFPKLLRNRS